MLPWVVNYRSHPRSIRKSFHSLAFPYSPFSSLQTPDVPIGDPLKIWTQDPYQVGTFRHLDLQTCLTLSPLFASSPASPLLPIPYSHTYTTAIPHPLCNQSVAHTFPHDGGCTPLLHLASLAWPSGMVIPAKSLFHCFITSLLPYLPPVQSLRFHPGEK
jgi:hypothetical protein